MVKLVFSRQADLPSRLVARIDISRHRWSNGSGQNRLFKDKISELTVYYVYTA